jgi:phosphoribosylamine--glycine ligase
MRFLGIGDSCDLGALYQRLIEEGHEVKVSVADPMARGTMAGLVENVAEARGKLQDQLRADGFKVIGGSAYGDRLENDRGFAQSVLAELGLPTCATHEFHDVPSAEAFLAAHPGRYVLKFNGPGFGSYENTVGRLPDGADIRAMLRAKAAQLAADKSSFILMSHVEGVEMGVGAYFNGERFIGRACLDWEHKRFFPGDIGELTGEMGTVATFDRSDTFFARTLQRMAPMLRAGGYCGYINLNTIVNADGIWPLEFTCRFGYPGFAVLGPLQGPWSELFAAMASRRGDVEMRSGFSVAIVLTTPPFPYDRSVVDEAIGLPVCFDGALGDDEQARLYYGEVGVADRQLVTSGLYGWTMVATGQGKTIPEAQRSALALADRVIVPNMRYRRDIGDRLYAGQWGDVERLGLLDPEPAHSMASQAGRMRVRSGPGRTTGSSGNRSSIPRRP